ncbi:hypothetical protein F7725_001309 [Dissostichus mawsoni]|uniref:Grh/CP2 DB domain-containing protein n=1 Tax=Dissostichus mawsoni TaxID=36200 RepID=A0A7J5ZGV8_DISMA|nr:hypothetical protein F7725_001309 [Dissostichus mawsoni]
MAWALKLPLTDEVIESGLVQDFDASLSGIGQELGAGAYSMRQREQILPFQYVLCAATSPAVKLHDETLTYLNQVHGAPAAGGLALEPTRRPHPGPGYPNVRRHYRPPSNPTQLNTVEFLWDPSKRTSVFIQVHCISTEFTMRKHGGEKGVPFRIQIDTFKENENEESRQEAEDGPREDGEESAAGERKIPTIV